MTILSFCHIVPHGMPDHNPHNQQPKMLPVLIFVMTNDNETDGPFLELPLLIKLDPMTEELPTLFICHDPSQFNKWPFRL